MVEEIEQKDVWQKTREFFSSRKNVTNLFVFSILAIALPSTLLLSQSRQTIQQQASGVSTSTSLGFGSFAGYDGSGWRCKFGNGANDQFGTGNDQAFSLVYNTCKDQFFSDIDYLGQNNIRSYRLTPYLSQFVYNSTTNSYGALNDNVHNLDEVLARFEKNNVKVHVVLNSTYLCDLQAKQFDYALFTNPTLQTQYLASLKLFLERYKNNTTIVSYDLLNEAAALLVDNFVSTKINSSRNNCMTASPDQIKSFLTKMYQAAKETDSRHKFTFSFPGLNNSNKDLFVGAFSPIVDIYDIHMYLGKDQISNPENYYKDFPTLDRPIIHGEIGVLAETDVTIVDKTTGQICDSIPFSVGYPKVASASCQEQLYLNTKTWVEKARERNIDTLFFHNFNNTNRFVFRTYTSNGSRQGAYSIAYTPTQSGTYLATAANIVPTAVPTSAQKYKIFGNIFFDTNRNGIKDTGESAYNSTISYELTPPAGSLQKGSTGSGGNYTINNLTEGTYSLKFIGGGYVVTTPQPGTFLLNSDKQFNVGFATIIPPTPTPTPNLSATPTAPSNFKVYTSTGNILILQWTNTSPATVKYIIAWSNSSAPSKYSQAEIAGTANIWQYNQINLLYEYNFHIKACNSNNICSAFTPLVFNKASAPVAPSQLKLNSKTADTITITWNDNSTNETKFVVAWSANSNILKYNFVDIPANSPVWAHTPITAGETYNYWVQSCKGGSCSPLSQSITVKSTP